MIDTGSTAFMLVCTMLVLLMTPGLAFFYGGLSRRKNVVNTALDVADSLSEAGISARVVDMRWAKPIDTDAVAQAASCKLVVTLEEGALDGGAGEGVLDVLSSLGAAVPTLLIGLPDEFVMQGKPDQVRARLGLDARGVLTRIEEKLASL